MFFESESTIPSRQQLRERLLRPPSRDLGRLRAIDRHDDPSEYWARGVAAGLVPPAHAPRLFGGPCPGCRRFLADSIGELFWPTPECAECHDTFARVSSRPRTLTLARAMLSDPGGVRAAEHAARSFFLATAIWGFTSKSIVWVLDEPEARMAGIGSFARHLEGLLARAALRDRVPHPGLGRFTKGTPHEVHALRARANAILWSSCGAIPIPPPPHGLGALRAREFRRTVSPFRALLDLYMTGYAVAGVTSERMFLVAPLPEDACDAEGML